MVCVESHRVLVISIVILSSKNGVLMDFNSDLMVINGDFVVSGEISIEIHTD